MVEKTMCAPRVLMCLGKSMSLKRVRPPCKAGKVGHKSKDPSVCPQCHLDKLGPDS